MASPFPSIEQDSRVYAALLKSMANGRRLIVLCHLAAQERTVGELQELLGISQSALSQHLARLRQANLVDTRRSGQNIYYRIKDPAVTSLLTHMNRLPLQEVCGDDLLYEDDHAIAAQ